MPSLNFFRTGKPDFRERLLPQAHSQEFHWVLLKASWPEASKRVVELFPKHTRADRPRPWYALLRGTHWPGQVPPGNGPFYLPEWAWLDAAPEERTLIEVTLRKAGFRRVEAHVVRLPQTREYLTVAMRASAGLLWNVSPVTYRAYLYPALRRLGRTPLRDYTTVPLRRT